MTLPNFGTLRRIARQLGQGMTELIIILVVVGIASIFIYTQYGDVLRNQTAAGAKALAGQGGSSQTAAAQEIASAMGAGASRDMRNFADSAPSGGGSPGGGGGGGDGGSPGGGGGSPDGGGGSPGEGGGSPGGDGDPDAGAPGVINPPLPLPPDTPTTQSPLDKRTVKAIIEKSETLMQGIAYLQAQDWKFVYDSTIDGDAEVKVVRYEIVDGVRIRLDEPKKIIALKNPYRSAADQAALLAHEVGHALGSFFRPDISSEDAFVNQNLASEGEAILYGIEVQREILAKDPGTDIGLAGTPDYHPAYNTIYERVKDEVITHEAGARAIGEIYRAEKVPLADGTIVTYDELYRGRYQAWNRNRRRP
jgi:hypothetical protein